MNILINDLPKKVAEKISLMQALEVLEIQTEGVAVAVNREIIHRQGWEDFRLNENDELTVFKLVTGG